MRHFAAAAKKLRHPPLVPKRAMLVNENAPLTKREHQIVQVLAEGITNKEIGRRLGLTEGTVKVHLHRIYRKLGIANRTVLAVLAPTIALIRR
jgi:two-component system, NarL family, nitrate/nitrite response regulator NarL